MDVLHVAVDGSDVGRTSTFYEEVLGLHETRNSEVDGSDSDWVGGEGPAETQFDEVDGTATPAVIDHHSVAVDAVVEEATSEWDSEVEGEPTSVGDQARIAFITDPGGYTVEPIGGL